MKRNLVIASVIAALALLGTAGAQVDLSPGVARVSLIHGDVSSQRGDTGDWAAAAVNQPLVAGDRISTGDRSRAELQLDHANILRLGNNSEAKVATLTRTQVQVQVGRGLAYYSVFKDSEADIEIDTPNVAVRPTSREGVYRIEVNGSDTRVIVRKGSADISTPQGSTRLEKGQSAVVRGTADEAEYKLAGAPSKDDWDSWNNERDGAIRKAQSWGHTNQYYVGSEDLDAYGRWVNVPDYGMVWAPAVSAGWAPYRMGRWVWEPYWGWTWVSYEPWGWAPYHYGRWFYWNSSWMWWPGPVYPHYRPIWAPAYVSFFGFGGHWGVGVGFGFGSVGWMPIGPCDPYYPWWGHHRSRFNAVNVTNITNITNIKNIHRGEMAPLHRGDKFSNLRLANTDMRVREAISTVPREHFATGRELPKSVSHEAFREGKLVAGNLPMVPTKDNLSVTNRPASATTLAPGSGRERFYSHKQPEQPQSFERQAAQVQRAIAREAKSASAERSVETPDARASSKTAGADQHQTQPARTDRSYGAQSGSNDGWKRFGRGDEAQNRAVRDAAPAGEPERNRGKSREVERNAGAAPEAERNTIKSRETERNAGPARSSGSNDIDVSRQERQADSERYGWHKFSRSGAQSQVRTNEQNEARSSEQPGRAASREYRPATPVDAAPARSETPRERGDGWQRFTPDTRSEPATRSERPAGPATERWTPAPSARGDRGSGYSRSSDAREAAPAYRPPLDLRQPIVTPRGGGGGGGGSHAAPASRGGSSPPARSSGGGGGGSSSKSNSSGGGSKGNRFR